MEFPDVEATMKKLGAAPTGTWPDGRPQYTLPVIHDDSTGKFVSDSANIAEYLEATYADKPKLFPFGAKAPVFMFEPFFSSTAATPIIMILLAESTFKLNPPSEKYFRDTREKSFGKKAEDWAPADQRGGMLAAAKEGMSKVAGVLSKNSDGPFFFGNTPSYADLVLLSYLMWMKLALGAEWNQIESWDGGRWKKFLDLTKGYQVIG